jgi:hypothetical protein
MSGYTVYLITQRALRFSINIYVQKGKVSMSCQHHVELYIPLENAIKEDHITEPEKGLMSFLVKCHLTKILHDKIGHHQRQ